MAQLGHFSRPMTPAVPGARAFLMLIATTVVLVSDTQCARTRKLSGAPSQRKFFIQVSYPARSKPVMCGVSKVGCYSSRLGSKCDSCDKRFLLGSPILANMVRVLLCPTSCFPALIFLVWIFFYWRSYLMWYFQSSFMDGRCWRKAQILQNRNFCFSVQCRQTEVQGQQLSSSSTLQAYVILWTKSQ